MYIPLQLICLLSWPYVVLGSFQVLVLTPSTPFKPGDTIAYTLFADPIPNGTLGMVLVPVQEGNAGNARPYTPFSATMAFSPQKFTAQIPTTLTLDSFYTLDAHADSSVESTLLGNSDPFQIEIPSSSSTAPIVATTESVTKTTVVQTATQSPSTTTAPATTSSSNSNPPSSTSAPTSSASVSASSQSPSEEPAATSSNSAVGSVTSSSSSSNASADASAISLSSKSRGTPIGAIVGGVIGGILIIILVLILLIWRRRRRRLLRDAVYSTPTDATGSSAVMIEQPPSASLSAGYSQRPFLPNRRPSEISPFIMTNGDSQDESSSPEFSSAKSREAFGPFGVGMGHIPALPSASLFGESIPDRDGSPDVLRSERERVLSEISKLRTGTTTGATVANTVTTSTPSAMQPTWSGSSASAVGSEGDKDSASEMRERLEQLTNHVRRLESALEQVSHGYDAPPVYDGPRRVSRV